jgi:hypothetical protein
MTYRPIWRLRRRSLIATFMAAALALAAVGSAPARAGQLTDFEKALLGLLAVGVIAKLIEEDPHRGGRGRVLPASCAFDVHTRDGWRRVLGRACLEGSGVRTARLPRQCAFEWRGDLGRRTVYGARCLEDAGWRIVAHGR